MSLESFSIVDKNPNDAVGGGGCLCSPNRPVGSCQGPYVVFQNAEVAGDPDAGLHNSPHAVASAACVAAAAKRCGGEVLSTAPADRAEDTPDLDFDELDEDKQGNLLEQFPKGGPTKLLDGRRVLVPPSVEGGTALASEVMGVPEPPSMLEDLLGDPQPGLQEPGAREGELVPATPDVADEPKPSPSDESEPELEL